MPASSASAKKTTTKKKPTKGRPVAAPFTILPRPRRLHLPAYKPFRFRHIKHPRHLPSAFQLSKKTIYLLWNYRGLFLGLVVVYGILDILLVRGFSGGVNVNSLKHQLSQSQGSKVGQLGLSFSVFINLLTSSSSSSTNSGSGAYQLFLGLIISLATIWMLRQTTAGEPIRFRNAFYKGMYPLIPFILVLLVVLLQTVPFLIGGGLYDLVVTNGIAVHLAEELLWGLLFAVLTFISVYMLCSSLFALYIVTLPDMTPIKALRSARQLVRYRRLSVFRKLLYLPIALLVVASVIMIPVIAFLAPAAPWVLFVLAIAALVSSHAYMYTLYRELLL
jgi:hypothetical protein